MTDINDNQAINTDVLQLINNPTVNAPTISRFVEEYFSELVPDSDYFAHLVRDDVGGEMLPPLPAEVIARPPRYYTAVTDLYDAPFLKTSQATALFTLTSSMMPNSYVRHGKRLVSPAVMVIHYGTSGAGKGNISDPRTLFEAVNRRLVRYDKAESMPTTLTKPEEVLARLPHEFTRADAVRVDEKIVVAVRTIERHLTI